MTVTGIPTVGSNLVLAFDDDQLEQLSGHGLTKPVRAAGLVGLSESRVRKMLGETATQTRDRLGYDVVQGERLSLTIKAGVVQLVSDENVRVGDLRPPTKLANPETIEVPADAPKGAIAKCGDGQYVSRGDDITCFGRSGVAQTYLAPAAAVEADVIVKCDKNVSRKEWNAMSATAQAVFCGTSSAASAPVTVACVRPSNIGTIDWNGMSAVQQRAVCVPEAPVPPNPADQPCPRPPTVGSLDWGHMSDEAKLAACRARQKP
ncbi:MAG: hypothetical protein ACRD2I_26390 [Vicinamibacterales bacterium]